MLEVCPARTRLLAPPSPNTPRGSCGRLANAVARDMITRGTTTTIPCYQIQTITFPLFRLAWVDHSGANKQNINITRSTAVYRIWPPSAPEIIHCRRISPLAGYRWRRTNVDLKKLVCQIHAHPSYTRYIQQYETKHAHLLLHMSAAASSLSRLLHTRPMT